MNYEHKFKALLHILQLKSKNHKYFNKENNAIRCYELSLLSYYYKQWTGEDKNFTMSPPPQPDYIKYSKL